MSRVLRLPVSTADQDISLAHTVASSDGRSSQPPSRSRAQIAFDETRIGESTGGQVPKDSELALEETHRSEDPRAALPVPRADIDEQRAKALIKGKLFRSKAAPVKLGRFTVLDRLGEGGMGVVYTAYDDRLDRKVAIKVLRSEATRSDSLGRARLQREAQAMARLSHPNIVTVHEVDTTPDDQLYVAMEFVRGVSLDAWLRHHERPWREVLAVFLQAGRGLQAAHDAGIIHRDFKPHNVLVGDDGSVKVLDFGLARATEHAGSEELASTPATGESQGLLASPLTQTGAIMGTPAYMAPEQHEGRPATAASDQFAFCISLYEGLYGRHPFSTSSLAALVGDVMSGNVAPAPKDSRVPTRLLRALQRGLAVAGERRWPSMAELLAELARDPEARRRRTLATATLAGFVGAAGFGAAALQQPAAAPVCAAATGELSGVWDEARGEAVRSAILGTRLAYASDTWTRLRPQLDAYAAQWTAMRAEACETHASGHQSDQLFDLRTACLDQRRAGLAGLVDALASADAEVVQKAAQAVGGLPPLARCADVAALTADVPPPDDPRAAVRVQGLRETLARAKAQEDAGRYAAGLATVGPVLAEAGSIGYAPLLAEAALRQGSAQMEAEQLAEADASLERALWTAIGADHDVVAAQAASKRLFLRAARLGRAQEALAEVPLAEALGERVAGQIEVRAELLNNLGTVYYVAADPERARRSMLAAVELRERHGLEDSIDNFLTLNNLGLVAAATGREPEAAAFLRRGEAIAERALGEGHPQFRALQVTLGYTLTRQGRFSEARPLLQRAVAFDGVGSVDDAVFVVKALEDLGSIALEERRLDEARRLFARVGAVSAAHPDLSHPATDHARARMGHVIASEQGAAAARAHFEALGADLRRRHGDAHPEVAFAELVFGDALVGIGEHAAALDRYRRAEVWCADRTQGEVLCTDAQLSVGMALRRLGEHAQAEPALRSALAAYERDQGADSTVTLMTALELGTLLADRRQFAEAVALLRRAEAGYAAVADADYPRLAEARLTLARALTGDAATAPDDARALARQALAVYEARGEPFAAEARATGEWLAAHGGR